MEPNIDWESIMLHEFNNLERDACALIALIEKQGNPSHANIVQTIDCLRKMGHRSGDIQGEGDGCGISTDLPRAIWSKRLAADGLNPYLSESRGFFVGHFLLPLSHQSQWGEIQNDTRRILEDEGFDLLTELEGNTRNQELGPKASTEAPLFWQVAGIAPEISRPTAAKHLFTAQTKLEEKVPELETASLSLDRAIYKLQGDPDMLPKVYPELRDPDMLSIMTLGHSRYSTNTLPTVLRSQPFSLLGHNGEINTIERLETTARMLGIKLVPGGSDSQNLNRILEGLIHQHGLDVMEALEMVFPPINSLADSYRQELKRLYSLYRWFFPSSAQGPAAIVARYGDLCLGSVDALGLRPLWFGESDTHYFLSSEKGVVDLKNNMRDPRPLAPGEKIAIRTGRECRAQVLDYSMYQEQLLGIMQNRLDSDKITSFLCSQPLSGAKGSIPKNAFYADQEVLTGQELNLVSGENLTTSNILAAYGWQKYDLNIRKRVAQGGREAIGSMGHTAPLACFNPESLPNLADFFKENVAVVTNPAIDRQREAEHFSTRMTLGSRPDICQRNPVPPLGFEVETPLLLGGRGLEGILSLDREQELARKFNGALLEEVTSFFSGQGHDPHRIAVLDTTFDPEEGLEKALKDLADQAREQVRAGSMLLLLDDSSSFREGQVYIDPGLATAWVIEELVKSGLRRQASLVVRSGAVRNLHDIMFLVGLGAEAVNPYLLWRISASYAHEELSPFEAVQNTIKVLQAGMEKVMSTMGIHEICGYGRIFSSIGLTTDLAQKLQVSNFCASEDAGLGLEFMQNQARERLNRAASDTEQDLYSEPSRNPKVGRLLRKVALGKTGYAEMARSMEEIDRELPTGLRHLLSTREEEETNRLTQDNVDLSVGGHDLPLVIAAMSFGSQGENSFRAYALAARKANIVCLNGEGGEIPDMLGKFRHNRGQQIASGRFGVFMGLLNSTDYLEIKIGQGAKPGEGGHLPGTKVSSIVAEARKCKPGITLISPSNQHDIYSIEDLAQTITELKTAHPGAKVSVKIPVTSGVGTIAVGIAKAGADVINISGFEGGTGAAREHAKRYVGLPVEIGVKEAHRALSESGIREQVEIWCDGGVRNGHEVLKLVLLGANRVGLGTLALMGIGCVSCRRCHLDRCPMGISTQLRTKEQAEEKGVKGFWPRETEMEAENLSRLLGALGDELRMRLARMGISRLQDLVGRSDLLYQDIAGDKVDLAGLLQPPAQPVKDQQKESRNQVLRKPLNYLTKLISDLAMERFEAGDTRVSFAEDEVRSSDRAIGTYLAGAMERKYQDHKKLLASLRLGSSVPGNGLSAFGTSHLEVMVEGGSQDGAAKGSYGGSLGVLRGGNYQGLYIDGSTGKSFAYGAIQGLFMIQNMADSRACVRLSGADVVFGGRITSQVRDYLGNIAVRSHLKGFAFEYMTGGRAVVLGDPGPWICAGMTGGVVYQCLYPEYDFGQESVKIRLARGANVMITPVSQEGIQDIQDLLNPYIQELEKSLQTEEANAVRELLGQAGSRFVAIVPKPLWVKSAE